MRRINSCLLFPFVIGFLILVAPGGTERPDAARAETIEPVASGRVLADTTAVEMNGIREGGCIPPFPAPPLPVPAESSVLALKRTDVTVRVIGDFADVDVVQRYHNPSRTPITVGYTFPLPGDAALRGMEMTAGDREWRADLKEIEEARRIYTEAEQAGHGAVLVEGRRENVFRAKLANIEPGNELALRLRYTQRVTMQGGRYRLMFPTVVAPRYCPATQEDAEIFNLPYVPSGLPGHSIGIRVALDPGAPVLEVASPSHTVIVEPGRDNAPTRVTLARAEEIPNRDFILTWKVADDDVRAGLRLGARTDAGTPFVLTVWPSSDAGARPRPRELVFILDSSGSMTGPKFDAARRAVKGLLRGLESGDRFRLLDFDDDFRALDRAALAFSQDALERADRWLDTLAPDGGTEILKPVAHALRLPTDRERERVIVLLTDGQVGNEAEVLAEVTLHRGNARIFTLGIDFAVNDEMLKGMARAGHGTCTLITPDEDVEGAVLGLRNRIRGAILEDVSVDGEGIALFPQAPGDLWPGEPLVIHGRFTGAEPRVIMLKAGRGGRDWSARLTPVSTDAGTAVNAVVAEKEIESLIDSGRDGDGNALKRSVIAVSLRENIASPYTAFVVVERRDERTETGAVRRVEVPVAFPHGWSWQGVYGENVDASKVGYGYLGGGRRSRGMNMAAAYAPASPAPLSASYGAPSHRASSGGGPMSPPVAADELADADGVSIAPDVAARRYLARNQRADGYWNVNGKPDARASALALLGLLKDYSSFRPECDRAIAALKGLTRADLADPVTAVLVHEALLEGLRATGQAATEPATRIRPTFSSGNADSDDANELARCAAFWLGNDSTPPERIALVRRLGALVATGGANAGAVRIGSSDPTLATAVYAGLLR
jgi:Ca-activated chloride channel family protein